jgi:hypothetical protein
MCTHTPGQHGFMSLLLVFSFHWMLLVGWNVKTAHTVLLRVTLACTVGMRGRKAVCQGLSCPFCHGIFFFWRELCLAFDCMCSWSALECIFVVQSRMPNCSDAFLECNPSPTWVPCDLGVLWLRFYLEYDLIRGPHWIGMHSEWTQKPRQSAWPRSGPLLSLLHIWVMLGHTRWRVVGIRGQFAFRCLFWVWSSYI